MQCQPNRRVFPDAKILIVDEERARIDTVAELLSMFGYLNVKGLTDSWLVRETFFNFSPDLVLLDLHLTGRDSLEVLRELQAAHGPRALVPVLVLTRDESREARELALAAGAMDYLLEPYSPSELALRTGNLLYTRQLHVEIERENSDLEARVLERTLELENAYAEVVDRLAIASEYRDDQTGNHTQRIGALVEAIARKMGMTETDAGMLGRAALLHDIGKVGIPDSILLKPGQLTIAEMATMETHVQIGARILANSRSKLLKLAEVIALTHHERWNGSGYLGLSDEDIPLPGRIVAVADVFDALVSRRPYKEPWPVSRAVEEIQRQSGSQFDPDVVSAFLAVLEDGLPSEYASHLEAQRAPAAQPNAPLGPA